jgi:hypothetical protein
MKPAVDVSLQFLHFRLSTRVHIYGFFFSAHKDIFVSAAIKSKSRNPYGCHGFAGSGS